MPIFRLLSACAISAAFILTAAAQSATAPAAASLQSPPPSKGSAALSQAPPPSSFVVTARNPVILNLGNGPCYTLRSYSITARDMESDAPKPSSSSTCIRPSTTVFKSTAAVLTK